MKNETTRDFAGANENAKLVRAIANLVRRARLDYEAFRRLCSGAQGSWDAQAFPLAPTAPRRHGRGAPFFKHVRFDRFNEPACHDLHFGMRLFPRPMWGMPGACPTKVASGGLLPEPAPHRVTIDQDTLARVTQVPLAPEVIHVMRDDLA
jgi:hypothetical protein